MSGTNKSPAASGNAASRDNDGAGKSTSSSTSGSSAQGTSSNSSTKLPSSTAVAEIVKADTARRIVEREKNATTICTWECLVSLCIVAFVAVLPFVIPVGRDWLQTSDSLFQRGVDFHSTGSLREAESLYRRAVAVEETPHVHEILGHALLSMDRLDESVVHFDRAANWYARRRQNQTALSPLFILGNILMKLGRNSEASWAFEKYVDTQHAMLEQKLAQRDKRAAEASKRMGRGAVEDEDDDEDDEDDEDEDDEDGEEDDEEEEEEDVADDVDDKEGEKVGLQYGVKDESARDTVDEEVDEFGKVIKKVKKNVAPKAKWADRNFFSERVSKNIWKASFRSVALAKRAPQRPPVYIRKPTARRRLFALLNRSEFDGDLSALATAHAKLAEVALKQLRRDAIGSASPRLSRALKQIVTATGGVLEAESHESFATFGHDLSFYCFDLNLKGVVCGTGAGDDDAYEIDFGYEADDGIRTSGGRNKQDEGSSTPSGSSRVFTVHYTQQAQMHDMVRIVSAADPASLPSSASVFEDLKQASLWVNAFADGPLISPAELFISNYYHSVGRSPLSLLSNSVGSSQTDAGSSRDSRIYIADAAKEIMSQGVPKRIHVVADAGDGLDVHRQAAEELEKALDLDPRLHSAAIERAEILREVGNLDESATELEKILVAASTGVETKKKELVSHPNWMELLLESEHGMDDNLDLLVNPEAEGRLKFRKPADLDESENRRQRSKSVRNFVRSLVKDEDNVDVARAKLGYVYHELGYLTKALGSLSSVAAAEVARSMDHRDFFAAMVNGQLPSSSLSWSPSRHKASSNAAAAAPATTASVRAAKEIFALRPLAWSVPPRVKHMVAALSGALTKHGPFANAVMTRAEFNDVLPYYIVPRTHVEYVFRHYAWTRRVQAMQARRLRHWQQIQNIFPTEFDVADDKTTELKRKARKDASTRFANLHGILEWSPSLPRAMRQAFVTSVEGEKSNVSSTARGGEIGAWLDVVDLGCGDGATGRAFQDLASSLYGIDLSLPMIERIRSLAKVRERRARMAELIAAAGGDASTLTFFPHVREFQRLAVASAERNARAASSPRRSPVKVPGAIGVDKDVKLGLMPGGQLGPLALVARQRAAEEARWRSLNRKSGSRRLLYPLDEYGDDDNKQYWKHIWYRNMNRQREQQGKREGWLASTRKPKVAKVVASHAEAPLPVVDEKVPVLSFTSRLLSIFTSSGSSTTDDLSDRDDDLDDFGEKQKREKKASYKQPRFARHALRTLRPKSAHPRDASFAAARSILFEERTLLEKYSEDAIVGGFHGATMQDSRLWEEFAQQGRRSRIYYPYDRVAHDEVHEAMASLPEAGTDLVLAGDLLPYVGDVNRLFALVSRAMRVNARFVLTVEDLRPEEFPVHGYHFDAKASLREPDSHAQEQCKIARVPQDVELSVSGRFRHSISYLRCVAKSVGLRLQSRDLVKARTTYVVSAAATNTARDFDFGSQTQGGGLQASVDAIFTSAQAVEDLGKSPFVRVTHKEDESGQGTVELRGSVLVFVKVREVAMTPLELAEILQSVS